MNGVAAFMFGLMALLDAIMGLVCLSTGLPVPVPSAWNMLLGNVLIMVAVLLFWLAYRKEHG